MTTRESPGREDRKAKQRETYRRPYLVKTDDENEDCKVNVVIPGLKKPSWLFGWGKNADIDVKFEDQSLSMTVELYSRIPSGGRGQGKRKCCGEDQTTPQPGRKPKDKYFYEVKRLPDEIDPYHSTYKVKDNTVELSLRKRIARSWIPELDTTGLETGEIPADSSEEEETKQ